MFAMAEVEVPTLARLKLRTEDGYETLHWFASINGEDFIEVIRRPGREDLDAIRTAMAPIKNEDGSEVFLLRVARRLLEKQGALFMEL